MTRRTVRLALVAFALMGAARSGQAASLTGTEAMLGSWVGLSERMGSPPEPVMPASLDLVAVTNRRLQGRLDLVAIVPCVFPVDLTRSASGMVTGEGVDEHGHRVLLHGKVAAFGDGSVRVAALQFKVSADDGSLHTGHLGLVQRMGGTEWEGIAGAHVTGRWGGSYTSESGHAGGLEMDLRNLGGDPRKDASLPSTGLAGQAAFEDVLLGDGSVRLTADLVGTIAPAAPDGPAQFALMGLATPPEPIKPNGLLAILIGLTAPPDPVKPAMLQGDYLLYDSLSAFFGDVVRGADSSLDRGTFELPALQ